MNSHFWFDKMSNGNMNTIRGQVVYPKLVKECKEEKDKEIRIEGANYELKQEHILEWLSYYGQINSEIQEEAVIHHDTDGGGDVLTGTGV